MGFEGVAAFVLDGSPRLGLGIRPKNLNYILQTESPLLGYAPRLPGFREGGFILRSF